MKIDIENPKEVLEDILTRINNGEYVKVVRCKDCEHCYDMPKEEGMIWDPHMKMCCRMDLDNIVYDTWFCAGGKGKEKPDGKTN